MPRKRGMPTVEDLASTESPELVELFRAIVKELKKPLPIRPGVAFLHAAFLEALAE